MDEGCGRPGPWETHFSDIIEKLKKTGDNEGENGIAKERYATEPPLVLPRTATRVRPKEREKSPRNIKKNSTINTPTLAGRDKKKK